MRIALVIALVASAACQNTDDPPARSAVGDPAPAVSSAPAISSSAAAPLASAGPAASAAPAPSAHAADSGDPPPPDLAVAAVRTQTAGGKTYDQTTTSVDVKVGDHFTVVVPGNATTAFTWRADPRPDAAVLSVTDPKYTPQPPPGCASQCVGYGGTYAFEVTANAAGTAKLQLVKVHVGHAPGAPVQQVSIAVTVK